MKVSRWIQRIGFLSIFFGLSSLSGHILHLLSPEGMNHSRSEITTVQDGWAVLLIYIGILIYTLYFTAGIFFIKKKIFSLKLMYTSLLISLLYVLISIILIKPIDSILFVALGPIIDLTLLIGVFRLRKYYFDPNDITIHLYGVNKLSTTALKSLIIFGLICSIITILIQVLWIYAFNQSDVQAERVLIFYGYLPTFLQEPFSSNYIGLIFSFIALICSLFGLKLKEVFWKFLNNFVLITSSLMFLLNLFQLM